MIHRFPGRYSIRTISYLYATSNRRLYNYTAESLNANSFGPWQRLKPSQPEPLTQFFLCSQFGATCLDGLFGFSPTLYHAPDPYLNTKLYFVACQAPFPFFLVIVHFHHASLRSIPHAIPPAIPQKRPGGGNSSTFVPTARPSFWFRLKRTGLIDDLAEPPASTP